MRNEGEFFLINEFFFNIYQVFVDSSEMTDSRYAV